MSADEVRIAIAAELSACEERVRALLLAGTSLSEREVVAIGERIAKMNREAVGNRETLDGLTRAFECGDVRGRSSLEATIRAQTTALATFTEALNAGLARQRDATAGIVEVAGKIRGFVAGIGTVSLDLRMLTLNAKLEASRWGAKGAAFAVVASGMRDLAGEVQRVNEQIGALAETLGAHTGRIVESEDAMSALSQQLSEDVACGMDEMRRAYEAARSSTAAAVAAGGARAGELVSLSNGMLTNLQFQDRLAQTLQEVQRVVSRARAVTCELADCLGSDDVNVRAVLDAARARAGADVVRLTAESELNSSDRGQASGVVEMF